MSKPTRSQQTFAERAKDPKQGQPVAGHKRTLPEGWNDPVNTTRAIAAAYGLCGKMFGAKVCSCQKAARMPCGHIAEAVEIVAARLAVPL